MHRKQRVDDAVLGKATSNYLGCLNNNIWSQLNSAIKTKDGKLKQGNGVKCINLQNSFNLPPGCYTHNVKTKLNPIIVNIISVGFHFIITSCSHLMADSTVIKTFGADCCTLIGQCAWRKTGSVYFNHSQLAKLSAINLVVKLGFSKAY